MFLPVNAFVYSKGCSAIRLQKTGRLELGLPKPFKMKKMLMGISAPLMIIFLFIAACLSIAACNKNGASKPSQNQNSCRLESAVTNLSGNYGDYRFHYDASGKVTSIVKHPIAGSSFSNDSLAVFYNGTIRYSSGHALTINYDANIYEHLPSRADVSLDSLHNYFTYLFTYDAKSRLIKVRVITNTTNGTGYAYDLTISYNEKDNVTGLAYEVVTGPRGVTTVTVSGYDDKPTPFASIKNYMFLMEAAWNNYDPEPVITALSKNNPLGYTAGAYGRTMSFTYNDKGMPIIRKNTNTVSGNSASFDETFSYQCK